MNKVKSERDKYTYKTLVGVEEFDSIIFDILVPKIEVSYSVNAKDMISQLKDQFAVIEEFKKQLVIVEELVEKGASVFLYDLYLRVIVPKGILTTEKYAPVTVVKEGDTERVVIDLTEVVREECGLYIEMIVGDRSIINDTRE